MRTTVFPHQMPAFPALKIILPPLVAVALFAATLFGIGLPAFERDLMGQKKKMIAAVTGTATSLLRQYDLKVRAGELSLADAQKLAAEQIRGLRYGGDRKDYFWINDTKPKMVMHPYRTDLEGRDISAYTDPEGTYVFREFVDAVRQGNAGYVPYLWQWNDDAARIEPKLSYVELFVPWGWIVGTGIYMHDVRDEIRHIMRTLTYSSVLIVLVVSLLSVYIIRQGMGEMKKRRAAEAELAVYHESLEGMVAQRTRELQQAMSEVKVLRGFLPICSCCKKIRDDHGQWNPMENYIRDHSEAEFSHSFCPACVKKMYPGITAELP